MKSKILLLTVCLATFISCKNEAKKAPEAAVETAEDVEAPILLGIQERETLEEAPYDHWFDTNYDDDHKVDTETISAVSEALKNTDMTIFMGTWCEDSQLQVPAFFHILDEAGYDSDRVTLITVSEEKDTPQGLEEGRNITNVPTIIFIKNDQELGRIVEFPVETLEKDMAKILSGETYKHTYAE